MTIKITCPHCAQHIEAPGEVLGTIVSCPNCNNAFHVGRRTPTDKTLKVGSYQGTCTNTTGKEPVISRLTLTVVRQEHQTVRGTLVTTGALEVNFEFSGTIAGNRIHFVTTTPNKKLTIEWTAEIQDDSVSGTFTSTNSGFWASVFGNERQSGEWQCHKQRFPIVGRVWGRIVSFSQGVLGLLVLCGIGGGIYALIHSDRPAASVPTVQRESYPTASAPQARPPESSPVFSIQPASQHDSFSPRVPPAFAAEAASRTYDFVLDQKRVDVSGYWRGQTFVPPYTRQPPGGFTLGDRTEAVAWGAAAAGALYGLDWLGQKLEEQEKKNERR